MSDTPELPELEPLEEVAAPAPAAAAAPVAAGVMPVSMSGMPAPAFGARAQTQYYRFMFAGVVMLLGCLMPFGPEWDGVGYKTLGGSVFTIISIGIIWTSWVAISHGKFDLSSMRWLILAVIPLCSTVWHLVYIFDEPAVKEYIAIWNARCAAEGKIAENIVISEWSHILDRLRGGLRYADLANSFDSFGRAYGSGKLVLLCGSAYAFFQFLMGIFAGMKAGKAQKAAREAGPRKRR